MAVLDDESASSVRIVAGLDAAQGQQWLEVSFSTHHTPGTLG